MLYLYLVCVDERAWHYLNPIFVLIGSLFPDADHKHAPAGKILPLWLWFKHRGFTHTIYGLVIFSGIISIFNPAWSASFALGYLSHLLLDSVTPSGVNWLLLKKKAYRKG